MKLVPLRDLGIDAAIALLDVEEGSPAIARSLTHDPVPWFETVQRFGSYLVSGIRTKG